MTPNTYRQRLEALPQEHEPAPYEVGLFRVTRNRTEFVTTRYVRATSPARAALAAVYINRQVFNGPTLMAGTPRPMMPVNPVTTINPQEAVA